MNPIQCKLSIPGSDRPIVGSVAWHGDPAASGVRRGVITVPSADAPKVWAMINHPRCRLTAAGSADRPILLLDVADPISRQVITASADFHFEVGDD